MNKHVGFFSHMYGHIVPNSFVLARALAQIIKFQQVRKDRNAFTAPDFDHDGNRFVARNKMPGLCLSMREIGTFISNILFKRSGLLANHYRPYHPNRISWGSSGF